ncbi:MAG: DNA gyrase inhibitor YacG [Rhodospirillaceae bacterium]|nr:DNA gyrase inhibitor YacG [Rhodospirillaceae bacterium]
MAKCPICGKPASPAHRPFCSARCKQIDLNRWLSEVYRVPAETPPSEDDDKSSD